MTNVRAIPIMLKKAPSLGYPLKQKMMANTNIKPTRGGPDSFAIGVPKAQEVSRTPLAAGAAQIAELSGPPALSLDWFLFEEPDAMQVPATDLAGGDRLL